MQFFGLNVTVYLISVQLLRSLALKQKQINIVNLMSLEVRVFQVTVLCIMKVFINPNIKSMFSGKQGPYKT